MIFKKLTFKNYKTYYGTQEIDLSIPNESIEQQKNIILFGGLNGAGKTTILKAILYVLFGKRGISQSTSSRDIEAEYTKLFSNVINNTFFDEGGRECSVSLILETDQGEEWTLIVKWYVNNFKKVSHEVREIITKKTKSSLPRRHRADDIVSYNKIIDKIIPFYAAPFFIFDGEEIRTLIEKQNTEDMKNAIRKISGIESNEVLIKDLNGIKSRLMGQVAKLSNSSKVENLNASLENATNKLNELNKKSVEYTKYIKEYSQAIADLRKLRQEKLLSNSKSRETISHKQGQIFSQLTQKQLDLKKFINENMISILLNKKTKALKDQLQLEKKVKEQKVLKNATLQPYDEFITKLFDVQIAPPLSMEQIHQLKEAGKELWLSKNAKQPIDSNQSELLHDLNTNDLNFLLNYPIKSFDPARQMITEIEQLTMQLAEIDSKLVNAPNAVDTKEEEKEIELKTKHLTKYQMLQTSLQKKLNAVIEEKRSLETQISKSAVVTGNVDETYAKLQYIDRTIKAIEKYEEEYTNYKANLIHTEFKNMLSKLFRKQDEFGKIEFDTNTFTVRLYNDRMQEISIQDRSAGEMQMISSALIWALTRASNLKLPVVIDTPLGRLDSYHRKHLIDHYYRYLSDQVIILSTDTEITNDYIDLMTASSHKQYMLDYDEEKKYTIIRDGYFKFVQGVI